MSFGYNKVFKAPAAASTCATNDDYYYLTALQICKKDMSLTHKSPVILRDDITKSFLNV